MAKRQHVVETAIRSYTLAEVIGNGGAGRVYAAVSDDGSKWAIKVLDLNKATIDRRKRFQNELQFCMKMDHPNIVKVRDYGTSEGAPFFVMPLFAGTLRRRLREAVNHEDALRLFAQLLDGVEAAHLLRVWHRDLKPENVLIDASHGTVVADFGIAHFEEEELYTAVETKDGDRLANFLYAAPEQRARGRRVDHRVDIFALGLMLNELFTHDVPQGSNPRQIASVAPAFGYLDPIVDAMIRQNPDDRPPIDRVKQLLIAHRLEFVARQQADVVSRRIVRSVDVSAPEPIRIVSTDYREGELLFTLSDRPPPDWQNSLRSVGGPYTSSTHPEMVRVTGNVARLHAGAGQEVSVKGLFTQWVERANYSYAEDLKEKARRADRNERERLVKDQQEAEYRARIVKVLNP